MAEVIDLVNEAQRMGLELEQRMREAAVAHMKEALDLFVRDGHCAVTLRIKEIPAEAFALIDLDEHISQSSLVKREWLTGSEPMLIVEYEREEDD